MDRETLKQKIADAIFDVDCRDGDAEGPRIFCDDPRLSDPDENCVCKRSADAVLSAISEAGCVIVPKAPTEKMCMIHAQKYWDEWNAFELYVAMLSASPFRQEE